MLNQVTDGEKKGEITKDSKNFHDHSHVISSWNRSKSLDLSEERFMSALRRIAPNRRSQRSDALSFTIQESSYTKTESPEVTESLNFPHEMDSCNMPEGSDDDSMDLDLSLSNSSSDDIWHPDLDDKISYEISALVREIAAKYTTLASDRQSPDEGRSNANQSSVGQPALLPTTYLSSKRYRAGRNNEDSDDEDSPNPPSKKGKHNNKEGRVRYLACPFAKNDPRKHGACFSNRISRIRDVKQHLARKHTPEFYCSRCLVIFPDQNSHHIHTSNAAGLFCKPSLRLDGISQSQRSRLSRKSNPKLPEEEQWFSIWDIIFPGYKRPESAYVDSGFSRDFCSYREYSQHHAATAVIEGLQMSSLAGNTVVTQSMWDEVRGIVADRLDLVFEEWRSNRSPHLTPHPENSSSDSQEPRTELPQMNTPNCSRHDSTGGGSQDMADINQLSFLLPTDKGTLEAQQDADGDFSFGFDFDFDAWEDLANQDGDLAGLNSDTSANFEAVLGFANSKVTDSTQAHDLCVST